MPIIREDGTTTDQRLPPELLIAYVVDRTGWTINEIAETDGATLVRTWEILNLIDKKRREKQ